VRYRSFNDRHFHQMLFRVINSLGDRVCYFVCFAEAIPYHTVSITHYHDGGEAKAASAFYDFRYALDRYNLFFEVDLACLYCTDVALCHALRILTRPLWRLPPKP